MAPDFLRPPRQSAAFRRPDLLTKRLNHRRRQRERGYRGDRPGPPQASLEHVPHDLAGFDRRGDIYVATRQPCQFARNRSRDDRIITTVAGTGRRRIQREADLAAKAQSAASRTASCSNRDGHAALLRHRATTRVRRAISTTRHHREPMPATGNHCGDPERPHPCAHTAAKWARTMALARNGDLYLGSPRGHRILPHRRRVQTLHHGRRHRGIRVFPATAALRRSRSLACRKGWRLRRWVALRRGHGDAREIRRIDAGPGSSRLSSDRHAWRRPRVRSAPMSACRVARRVRPRNRLFSADSEAHRMRTLRLYR